MVTLHDKEFRQLMRQQKRNAEVTEKLISQIDQLLYINQQLLDMVVAGAVEDDELDGPMFLDGTG
jgi:hypothetical protein